MKSLKIYFRSSISLLILIIIMSCSSGKIAMPISESEPTLSRIGEIVWLDLVTNEPIKSKEFFSELLDWNFKDHSDYSMVLSNDKPICGIINDKELEKGSQSSYWVTSAAVKNIKETTETIKKNGGKILAKPFEIENRGIAALAEDSQGALFAVLQNDKGLPKPYVPKNNEWMWAELWTNDLTSAVSFYNNVLNTTSKTYSKDDDYYTLKANEYEFAGITELPVKNEKPVWIPVLKVNDVDMMSKKVKELGGYVMIEPIKKERNNIALVATPFGAPFLITEWRN